MENRSDSQSPEPEDVARHYASGYEEHRLEAGTSRLEAERTRELLKQFLPQAPAVILDVGGGPGAHAYWLARQGYEVHLIDVVLLHVELAKEAAGRQPDAPLASVNVGDACSLSWKDESVNAVLLFGPLYHLTNRNDRLRALREARRVVKPGGVVLAVGISRFASTLDGIRSGFLKDAQFAAIVEADLKDGQHRNPTGRPAYFMDTFFHHPDELPAEVVEAGLAVRGLYGIEGPGWLARNFDEWWESPKQREVLIDLARKLETEPSLMGLNAHLMVVAGKLL